MIRAKGGRRQPRQFYLKKASEERLIKLMEIVKKPEERIDEYCKNLLFMKEQVDNLITAIFLKLKK